MATNFNSRQKFTHPDFRSARQTDELEESEQIGYQFDSNRSHEKSKSSQILPLLLVLLTLSTLILMGALYKNNLSLGLKEKEIQRLSNMSLVYIGDIAKIREQFMGKLEAKDKEIQKFQALLMDDEGEKQRRKGDLQGKKMELEMYRNISEQCLSKVKKLEVLTPSPVNPSPNPIPNPSSPKTLCPTINDASFNKTLEQKQSQIKNLSVLKTQQNAKIAQLTKEIQQKQNDIIFFKNSSIDYLGKILSLKEEREREWIALRDAEDYLGLVRVTREAPKGIQEEILKKLVYKEESLNGSKVQEKIEELKRSSEAQAKKYAEEQKLNSEDYYERLAVNLTQASLTDKPDPRIFEVEYVKADAKHSFSKAKEELPICVIIEDDAGVAEDNARVLESLERQNYTNFHVVWIQEGEGAREGQKWPDNRVKNRLKVVKNQQKQGTTANLYFWGGKFCGKDDIAVPLGKGAGLLGRQSLKILNSVYQSPDIMFTRSPVLLKRSEYDLVSSQLQEPEEELSKVDRKYSKKQGLIRSFRRKVLDSVPFENLLKSTEVNKVNVSSLFFESDSNVFPLYAGIESLAKGKGVELKEYLQISYRVETNCEKAHQEFIKAKAPLKTFSNQKEWKELFSTEKALQKCLQKYRQKIEFNLENPVRVVYGDKIYKRTIYNEKGVNPTMGKNPKFLIDLKQFLPRVTNEWRSFKSKQVKNENDLYYSLNSKQFQTIIKSNRIDFQAIKLGIQNQFSYEILEFKQDKSIQMTPPMLIPKVFKNSDEAHRFIVSRLRDRNGLIPDRIFDAYQIAYRMQLYPDEPEIIESEYYFVDKKYNGEISKQKVEDQIPICIISAGYKIKDRKNGTGDGYLYKTYFDHFQTLNYTNYHVVYIDDASPDGSAEFIYNYINNSSMKIKNRIKIIHTLRNLGITTNLMYWPQKMCGPDQVVVYIDADDNILGRQSLRIFNHLYRDTNVWYAFSRHMKYMKELWRWRGRSFGDKNVYVRWTEEWAVSNTRTFRSNLMRAVPFSHMIEYHYDPKNYTAWPVFQDLSADGIQVSAHVELAGNSRIAYYDGITYGYSGTSGVNKCYEWIEKYDWRKTMTRSRLQPLEKLDGFTKGKMYEGEEYQWKLHRDANGLVNLLQKNKCYI